MTANTPRFPIAFKLGIGFVIAFLMPSIILAAIFLTARQDIDQRNIESYIRQVGQRQRQSLTTSFARAKDTLITFTTERDTNDALVGLLLNDVQTNPPLPTIDSEEVSALIESSLLISNNTSFNSVTLLDPSGTGVALAGDPIAGFNTSTDLSNSEAYQQIAAAQQNPIPEDQIVVVTQRGGPVIEIATVVKLRTSGNVIGYLVANVNLEVMVEPVISFVDSTFPAYSYLRSERGVLISPRSDETAQRVQQVGNTTAIEQALGGAVGFDIYRLQDGVGEEVGGYYAPIEGTPLILITEVPINAVLRQPMDYFGIWGFVLISGSLALVLISLVFAYNHTITRPIYNLRRAMQAVGIGNYDEPVPDVTRGDEFGELSRTFVDMRQQTRTIINDLQARIGNRTRDIETTQEISRVAVTQRDLQNLMDDVVNLIIKRFPNIYHAQIFLLDSDRRNAVLRASTNEVGQEMLARGHRLAVGSISVIGQVTSQGDTIIARDTAVSEVHKQNEFLPDTRAELAIPLRIGTRVIGALDVQSRENSTFEPDQVQILQIMADQVAIAIENARLYQESTRRIRSIEERSREETLRAWQDYMFDQRTQQLVRRSGVLTDVDMESIREKAMRSGEPAIGEITDRETIPIAVPLKLRSEVIGVVAWELPAAEYNGNRVQLAKDLVERLALSLDNTRLFEQSQRATERERLVNDISAKLTVQTDVNEILQTAVREVGQALRAPQVSIRLSRRNLPDHPGDNDSKT